MITTKNPKLVAAYQNAIRAWNQTGCFNFQLTNNPNAPIKLNEKDLSSSTQDNGSYRSQELGITYNKFYAKSHGLVGADVNLDNSQELLSRPVNYITIVAEHELGHAIGLKHQPENAKSVMVPVNAKYPIQPMDIQNVKQLYNH